MNLDMLKDPSRMKNSAKFVVMIAVFLAAGAAGFFLDTSDQITRLDQLAQKEQDLRTTWLDRKRQAVNLEAHKKQLQEIEVAFGTLLRQLPNKAQMDALLNDINQAGIGRGLSFDLFKPAPSEILSEFYAEQPVNITVSGSYHDFGAFAEDVSRLPRIVNLGDMNIRTLNDLSSIVKGAPPRLAMDATVRTYRYLDEKEIEARRKAKKK